MTQYDEAVLQCFLKKQGQLFLKPVASNQEEARQFLQECMAVVADSEDEVRAYFEEEGVDTCDYDDITEAHEVFAIGDGRYLIVED